MCSLKNQQNFSEENKEEDIPGELDQAENNYSGQKKYYEKLGNAGIKGSLYQINILTMVLLNGMQKVKHWRLSTEDKNAAQLDDLIFEYLPTGSAILLQAKHKEDEKKEVTYKDLMSVSRNPEFSLPKYFFSYQEVKGKFKVQKVGICTNLNLDENVKSIAKKESVDQDSVLYFEGAENVCYAFSSCSLPALKQNIKIYHDKYIKNKEVNLEVNISDEEINDFLKHLKFFPNFLSEKIFDKMIQQTISRIKLSKNLNTKMIQKEILKKITDWFKEKKGTYLTEMEAKAIFCDIRSNKYCDDLIDLILYDICFKKNNLPPIILQMQERNEKKGEKSQHHNESDAPAKDSKQFSHIIPDKEYVLNVIKIYQALPTSINKKTLFVNPDETLEVQRQIIDAFEVPHYTILVMVCPNMIQETIARAMCDKMMKILVTHKYKHVILIADERNSLAVQLKHANINYYEVTDSITFEDVEETTREEFKRKKLINFQGNTMSLEELFIPPTDDDLNQIVTSEVLLKLSRGQRIDIGLKLPHPDNYYINRSFHRNGKNIFEEDFWRSTEANKEKVVLISDSAGMGKSTVLTSLAVSIKNGNPHLWVVRFDLGNYTTVMKTTFAKGRKSISITELLDSQVTSKIENEIGKKLFTTPNRVVLMLDGVDEVSPRFIALIENLIRDSLAQVNLAKLFVTTRPHRSKDLEEILKLQSFTLKPFSKPNQIHFLINYWTENLDIRDDMSKDRCKIFAKALIEKISVWLNEEDRNNLTGIPLQTRMLAEIFQEKNKISDEEQEWEGCKEFSSSNNEKPKLPTRLDLTQLYTLFTDKKRDIFIKNINSHGDISIDEMLEEKFEECQEYHRALALKVICDSDKLELFSCYTNVKWPISSSFGDNFLFKVGIVQKQGENIEFLHRTFAEYSVVECCLIELERKPVNEEFQQFFMSSILMNYQYYMIRAFLDSRMSNVWNLVENNFCSHFNRNRISEESLKGYFRVYASEGCVRIMECFIKCIDKEQRKILFEAVNELDLMYDALSSAIEHGHLNTLKLLLELNETFNKGKDSHKQFLASVVLDALNTNTGTFQFLSRKVHDSDINILELSESELHEVAFIGRFQKVELWIVKAEADVNTKENIRDSLAHCGAVYMNRLEAIKFVMEEIGADVNAKDRNGKTVLHIAVYEGELEIVQYLVKEAGADTNVKNWYLETALHRAACGGNLEIVKCLVKSGAVINVKNSYGDTPLHRAAYGGKLEIVKCLVEEAEADINAKNHAGETALHKVVSKGNLEIVRYLVEEAGVDINDKNNKSETALYKAVCEGELEIVRYLVKEGGADIYVENEDGESALHKAVYLRKLEIVKYLVKEAGADINVKNSKGETALHIVAFKGELETVRYLVEEAEADVYVQNRKKETALHKAVSAGKLEVVEYLVEHTGSNINVKNSEGETALHKAVCCSQLEAVKYPVEEAAADINVKNSEMAPYTVANKDHYYWRDYDGKIPSDAIPAGENHCGVLYFIGQAYIHNYGLLLGSIIPGSMTVNVPCYGVKTADVIIKILCAPTRSKYHWLSTSSTTYQKDIAGKCPVLGGYDQKVKDNRNLPLGTLHIGRILWKGEFIIGNIAVYNPDHPWFYYPLDGTEMKSSKYEVLIYSE